MSLPKNLEHSKKIVILDSGEWVKNQSTRQFNHQVPIATFGNADIEAGSQVWHDGQRMDVAGGLDDGRVMVRPDQGKRQWLILDTAQITPI